MCCRLIHHRLFHLFTVPLSMDSESSLSHLMDKVAVVIPHKNEIGRLQLGLTPTQIQTICPLHQSFVDYHRAFTEMFGLWKRSGSPPYTWRTIIGVLRTASVGEVRLSEELTTWIAQGH